MAISVWLLIFQHVFMNFSINIFLLLRGMQTTQSIRNVMVGNTSMNQLVNKVSFFLLMKK
jgi:hypothetical protein